LRRGKKKRSGKGELWSVSGREGEAGTRGRKKKKKKWNVFTVCGKEKKRGRGKRMESVRSFHPRGGRARRWCLGKRWKKERAHDHQRRKKRKRLALGACGKKDAEGGGQIPHITHSGRQGGGKEKDVALNRHGD